MKITDVRVFVTRPAGLNYVVIKVLTDEGVYGVGEGSLNGSEVVVARYLEHIKELLIGQDRCLKQRCPRLTFPCGTLREKSPTCQFTNCWAVRHGRA